MGVAGRVVTGGNYVGMHRISTPRSLAAPSQLGSASFRPARCPYYGSISGARHGWSPPDRRKQHSTRTRIFPFDLAWDVDSQSLASNLFATSIIPYAGFLYHLQKSKKAPKLMLFGFYFLLVFVLATIVAGIYAKIHYQTILANVDWLHGSAESFLTLTNLFIVLGLRQGIQAALAAKRSAARAQESDDALRSRESGS